MGDTYAICLTASQVSQQDALQRSLLELLENESFFRFKLGDPDPSWRAHNESVLKHTVLRRRFFVAAEPTFEESSTMSFDGHPELVALLDALNGDWTLGHIEFWTAGREIDEHGARELVYSSCIAAGLLLSANNKLPSIDDWGDAGAC